MKALVITDNQEILRNVKPVLTANGYDLIHYRWIIKALDNIEEIQPDIIVVSAEEYPRHWKTLAGFIQSGIGGNKVTLYLYDMEKLEEEDAGKTIELDVHAFDEINEQSESSSEEKNETLEELPREIKVQLAFNSCENGNFVFAQGSYYPDSDYVQIIHSQENTIHEGDFIKYVTVFDGEKTSSFSAMAEKSKTNFEGIDLRVKNYYEKEI